jgi:hypothetical protein
MHSVEHIFNAAQRRDNLEDREHKRVIDNFVVKKQTFSNFKKNVSFFS